MAPPIPIHPVSSLPSQIAFQPNGKPRKPSPPALHDCALKEMLQYKCNIKPRKQQGGMPVITCEPFVRMFRVCDGLHVETTAWEKMEGVEGAKS